MTAKNLPLSHELIAEVDLADDDVDKWEEETWLVIEAALAEASFQRGDYTEFDIEKFLIEVPKRRPAAKRETNFNSLPRKII